MIKGRGLSPGEATSSVVVCDQFISPLGEISREGLITSGPCENVNITGKILAFKGGRGSTVGSYTFLELKSKNIAPVGLINESAEQMVVTGAIISEIPMVDMIPLDIFSSGDKISINGSTGEVLIQGIKEKKVTTVYLMHLGKILLLKRSEDATSFPGQYSGVSGYIEKGETPEQTGRREMMEECAIQEAVLKKIGKDIYVRSGDILYIITPMLMESKTDKVKLNEENSAYYWVTPEELYRHETVPKFKETFGILTAK
ncbi:MAG: aconitase X swivel domain-containing protein [Thermoplasmata archaeon]